MPKKPAPKKTVAAKKTVSGMPMALLDLEPRSKTADIEAQIAEIAAASPLAKYEFKQRGVAPRGYIKGMAVAYSRMYRKLTADDPAARFVAQKDTGLGDVDALTWYRERYAALNMKNDKSGSATLRHVFVLLVGLGMRESSGRYCEGRDMSAGNTSGEKCETGLFQTSYNAISADPIMKAILTDAPSKQDGLASIFSEGVKCKAADWKIWGTGSGAAFQKTSKEVPYLAVEFAAAGLRCIRKHWGPINTRAAELRPEADALFQIVETIVDNS